MLHFKCRWQKILHVSIDEFVDGQSEDDKHRSSDCRISRLVKYLSMSAAKWSFHVMSGNPK